MSIRVDMQHRGPAVQGRREGGWMVTLADLMALMLTFFVLMFSMQRIETGTWESVRQAIEHDFSGKASKPSALPPEEAPSMVGKDPRAARDTRYLAGVLSRNLSTGIPGLRIDRSETTLVLSMSAVTLDTLSGSPEALGLLAEQLRRLGEEVSLLGIAPDRRDLPVAAERWRRALTRAETLAQGLRDAGFPGGIRLGATGGTGDQARGGLEILIDVGGPEVAR